MVLKNYYGLVLSLIVMTACAAVMAIVATLYIGLPLSFASFFKTAASAFTINFLASLVIPVGPWGLALAAKCNANPGTMKFALLTNFVMTLIYVTIISFGMTALDMGFSSMFLNAWLHAFPILLVAGYLACLIVQPIASRIANSACRKYNNQ